MGFWSKITKTTAPKTDDIAPMSNFLLIGLGNPGKDYQHNRHNIGFMAVDAIAGAYGFSAWKKSKGALMAEGTISGKKTLLVKPQGYMNLSGEAAGPIARFYKIPLEHITVFHDELDLDLGKLRVKRGGGHGGHNGLKSLDTHLGTDYRRVRIGISHPGDKDAVSDYVLSDFAKSEQATVELIINTITKNIDLLINNDAALFATRFAEECNDG